MADDDTPSMVLLLARADRAIAEGERHLRFLKRELERLRTEGDDTSEAELRLVHLNGIVCRMVENRAVIAEVADADQSCL